MVTLHEMMPVIIQGCAMGAIVYTIILITEHLKG